MEKLISDLEKELKEIIEGKKIPQKRKNLGDLVDIRVLRMINFSLQWTSVGYQSALRLAGMKFGKRLGQTSDKGEISHLLQEIKKLFEILKWGEVEIEITPRTKEALIKIYESPITAKIPPLSQKICHFEEGFIEGYLDGVISQKKAIAIAGENFNITNISCEEKKCVGAGDDFCGFLIKF